MSKYFPCKQGITTYSAQVVVSVVTNLPKYYFGNITTMQEMTSAVCDSIATGTEGQLTDTRDNNVYHVGKMLDGKCWMLQNLALGSTAGTTSLTSSDSNVTSNWTLPQAYTSATSGSASATGTAVWNFGKWVLATPLLTESCGSSGISSIASCVKTGFVDVSDSSKFEPTFTAKTMAWNGANSNSNTLVAVNCTSWSGSGTSKTCTAGTYDAHYLVGNYYQWRAATANLNATSDGTNVSGSICPKGWKLPTRGTSSTNGDFYKLTNAYGVSSSVSGSNYNIAGSPLSFVRSGFVTPGNRVSSAGQYGLYWSSTAYGSYDAYLLYFDASSVAPSGSSDRSNGRAVRCIAE